MDRGKEDFLGEMAFFLSCRIQPAGSTPCLSSPYQVLLLHPSELLTQPCSLCCSHSLVPFAALSAAPKKQAEQISPHPPPLLNRMALPLVSCIFLQQNTQSSACDVSRGLWRQQSQLHARMLERSKKTQRARTDTVRVTMLAPKKCGLRSPGDSVGKAGKPKPLPWKQNEAEKSCVVNWTLP